MRKKITVSIDGDVIHMLQEIRKTKGVPIGRSLELAFLEVHKEHVINVQSIDADVNE